MACATFHSILLVTPPQTQEQSDVLAVAAYIVGSAPQPSLPQQQPDKEKKLRNLKKVSCVQCRPVR